jgi:hypothetical protein
LQWLRGREYDNFTNFPVSVFKTNDPNSMVSNIFTNWAKKTIPKPLFILCDETDALEGDAMINFLRQLRGGFMERGVGKFPVSSALVGMRDLKDYITVAKKGAVSGGMVTVVGC